MDIVDHYISLVGGQKLSSNSVLTEQERARIFYVLTRQEEIDRPIRNKWGNWRFSYTLENFTEPYLDKYVIEILNNKGVQKKSIWPDGKEFAVCLTHDVDAVSFNSPEIDRRSIKRTLKGFSRYFSLSKNTIRKFSNPKHNDLLWHFEDWLKVEDNFGYKSTFFFFVLPNVKDVWIRDCLYSIDDYVRYDGKKMKVREMIKEIHQAGWEIGLHSSFNSFDKVYLIKEQKAQLEDIVGEEVVAVRQHYLHYDVLKTPRVHNESGIKIDSSQGFARTLGFRAGTCFPYLTYDHVQNKTLDTVEIPMIIMDDPLFNDDGLELAGDFAVEKCIHLMKKVKEVGGGVTINFHGNHLNQKGWFQTYKKVLEYTNGMNSYVSTSKQIHHCIGKFINE